MRVSLTIAAVSALVLATSCARQYSTSLELSAEDPETVTFSRSDCDAFVAAADNAAGKLRLARTASVADGVFGYNYMEFSSEGVPVSIAVFCAASILQVRTTAIGRDPAGITKQPRYYEANAELVRVLTERYGPQLRQRTDSVNVKWWPWGDDAY